MPIGLEGGYILLKASCETCRKQTHEFETICLRQMYFDYRRRNRLIRHANDIPAQIPLAIDFEPHRERRSVAPHEHPSAFVMPLITTPPGIFSHGAPGGQLGIIYNVYGDPEELRRLQRQHTGALISTRIRFDFYAFFRMIAKIAHSFAVGEIGIDNFDPELPDLILGRNPGLISYLIGNLNWPLQNCHPQTRHQMEFSISERPNGVFGVVTIRLFASSGTPRYEVVVGQITNWPAAQRHLGLV